MPWLCRGTTHSLPGATTMYLVVPQVRVLLVVVPGSRLFLAWGHPNGFSRER
jgi:hypothetical protein